MGTITKNGTGFPDLTNAIVEDIEQGVKEAHKRVQKMNLLFKVPTKEELLNWRTPLVIENHGKTTIHGERNQHLVFERTD